MSGQENICSAFPWEMVPCQGNHVLMETPVVGQHKVRRGAREQREKRQKWKCTSICVTYYFCFPASNVMAVFVTSILFVLDISCLLKTSSFVLQWCFKVWK